MSRRKQPRVSRELQDAAAERWRERLEADAKPTKPSAPAWRSMASAPRDGSNFCGVVAPYRVVRIGCICADGEHFRGDDGGLYRVAEMLAWAPIPEWTGEVAE